MSVTLDSSWELSPSVALRPEPFGALAYHFGNRKLTFLKRPELVSVVRTLGSQPDVRSTLETAGVPAAQHAAYLAALDGLAAVDMIRPLGHGDSGHDADLGDPDVTDPGDAP